MRYFTSIGRVTPYSKRLRIIGALVLCILFAFCCVLYYRSPSVHPCDSPYANIYDVVIDAGSTGSRVYIFQYERRSDGVVLLRERYQRIQPGLSSYAIQPDGARVAIAALLHTATDTVPSDFHRCTAVTLRATAGLRLLAEVDQRAVLHAADAALKASPFRSRGALIMPGSQEGVYGWLTVNYLLRTLDTDATVATIDMGGASVQVVFETDQSTGEWLPFNYAYHLRTAKRHIAMYQNSYLGLGMNEGKRMLMNAFLEQNGTAPFSCFSHGYKYQHNNTELRNDGAANFDDCAALFQKYVFSTSTCKYEACGARGVPQPALTAHHRAVYAFSYFYDRLFQYRNEGEPVFVSTYREVGKYVCQRSLSAVDGFVCMELAYLYSFLTYGLGLGSEVELKVPNQIDGMAVSWTLGSSLAYVLHME